MIVLVSPRLGFHGGVERHVYDLAGGLRQRGMRVTLVYGDESGRDPARFAGAFDRVASVNQAAALLERARHVYIHKLDDPRVWRQTPAHVPVTFAVHDHDATCVRSHRYVPVGRRPCSRAPGVACLRNGCVVVRDRGGRSGLRVANPFALAERTRRIGRRAKVVTCSAFVRRTLLDVGLRPERVRVIHPVPPPESRPLEPCPDQPIVAFAGQVIRGKGLDLAVSALAGLPGFQLVVAGDGNDRGWVEALARRLGVVDRVEFLGALAPEAMSRVYDRARVVVVPSRWPEPFGMVGIEAMRRGRPVVAARHGGIPEWLDDDETGLGFAPGDARSLAEALRRAVDPATHDRLSRSALARTREAFCFDEMVDQVVRWLGVTR